MIDLKTINNLDVKSAGYFRFKKLGADYLLTNEIGEYVWLKENDFKKFISGKLNKKDKIYQELLNKSFLKDQNYLRDSIFKFRSRYHFLKFGPSLHIDRK